MRAEMDILEELRELKAKYAALLALSATLQSQEHELLREVAVGSGLKRPRRLAFISRSLLLYAQWHALPDEAVPAMIYKTDS